MQGIQSSLLQFQNFDILRVRADLDLDHGMALWISIHECYHSVRTKPIRYGNLEPDHALLPLLLYAVLIADGIFGCTMAVVKEMSLWPTVVGRQYPGV